jgi:hypothetical protein
MKSFTRIAVCLIAVYLPALASDHCTAGSGGASYGLWDGYTIQIAAGEGERAAQCHVTISNAGGTAFETYAYDVQMHEYSGRDINNDGKPDVVLFGKVASEKDSLTYWIVSLVEPAGLARQIQTVYPLTFEDRDGDGKMEIWTREWSYDGIDGLYSEDSPHPPIAFRLVGNRLIYVSNLFPAEYEAEVIQARQHITEDGVSKLKNEESTGMQVQKEKAGAKDKDDPKLDARAFDAKVGILQVATDYLYAGKSEWIKELQNWPYNDRDRIRTIIIQKRMGGMMKQLNAPQPAAPKQASATTAQPSTPQ